MDLKEIGNEIFIILLASVILTIATAYLNTGILLSCLVSFIIIISANIIIKKMFAYHFEISIKTKFWAIYQYGIKKSQHFKKPMPTIWMPLLFALLSKGYFLWLGILEYDASPKAERASKRHGLYRFTEITERHLGTIAFAGVLTNLILGFFGYMAGFELFARLNVYFAMWSMIPLSRLDGAKILFGNRILWVITFVITSLLFILSFAII